MRVYINPKTDFGFGLESDEITSQQLAIFAEMVFSKKSVDGRAEWYYDEFVDPIEHGVKIDINGLDRAQFILIIGQIADRCLQHCDKVVIEVS